MTKLAQLFLTSIARRTLLLVISGFGLELFYRKLPGAVGHQLCHSLGDRQPEASADRTKRIVSYILLPMECCSEQERIDMSMSV